MTTMQIAFFKHALTAGLLAALLGALAPLAEPAAAAPAQTGGEAQGATQTTGTPSTGTPVAGATPTGGSTTSGSASGGAAPTPTSPSPGRPTRATWYGPGFYGHTTACGQKLTRRLVGLASRTLPCGTLVRVSYRGHVLTAPVLDRGPYGNGAMWDLTSGAAHALEIKETVRIDTQVVGTVPNTPTLGESPFSTPLSPVAPSPPAGASSAPLAGASATPSAATGGAAATG
jgi:rare lipoprotein A (peptidoglycan hydrolase)